MSARTPWVLVVLRVVILVGWFAGALALGVLAVSSLAAGASSGGAVALLLLVVGAVSYGVRVLVRGRRRDASDRALLEGWIRDVVTGRRDHSAA